TSPSYGAADAWAVKVAADGTKQWENSYGTSGTDWFQSGQQTVDGGYILAGGSTAGLDNHGSVDYWVVKTDAPGNILWARSFGGSGDDECFSVKQTSDGGYVLAGYSNSGASSTNKTEGNFGGYDFWVVKLDLSGNKQWDRTFGGSA